MSDSSKNEMGPKGQTIMGIVFMFGSLMVILVALSSMLGSSKEREAVDWPKVQGDAGGGLTSTSNRNPTSSSAAAFYCLSVRVTAMV